jgi:hypothetical protein
VYRVSSLTSEFTVAYSSIASEYPSARLEENFEEVDFYSAGASAAALNLRFAYSMIDSKFNAVAFDPDYAPKEWENADLEDKYA